VTRLLSRDAPDSRCAVAPASQARRRCSDRANFSKPIQCARSESHAHQLARAQNRIETVNGVLVTSVLYGTRRDISGVAGCLLRLTLQENSQITGGTGLFAHATGNFTGTISPQGRLPRNAEGQSRGSQPSLHEADTVTFSGTLSLRPQCSKGFHRSRLSRWRDPTPGLPQQQAARQTCANLLFLRGARAGFGRLLHLEPFQPL
jgi:hypothetical protein